MPNITAAKKSLRVAARRRLYNDRRRKAMRMAIKNFRALVAGGDTKEAQAALPTVYKAVDKAAKRGVIKKNTASRYKSRLSKMLISA